MMEGITPTMPIAPAYSNGDGMMGGSNWIWIILIFFLIGGNNGGGLFGGGGVAANGATNLINNDFLYSQQKIDNLGQAIITQTNQLNQTMNAGFNGVQMALCQQGHQIDSGFCQTNRNIDSVKFQMAQDTCTITSAIGASAQTLLNYMTGQEIANWRERALSAENRENNANQTAAIIGQLQPYPTPSYLTAPAGVPFGYYPGAYGGPSPFGFGGCEPCGPRC